MATSAQIEKHVKLCLRKKAFNLAILQLINNDPVEFRKRVQRTMETIGTQNAEAESKIAIDDFISSL